MIFDASSIIAAVKEGKLKLLAGEKTCELAYYEIGNAIWKEAKLFGSISLEEAETMLKLFLRVLGLMKVERPECMEVLKIASELKITFYDASYVQLAIANGDILVTEDAKLRERVRGLVEAKSVSEIL